MYDELINILLSRWKNIIFYVFNWVFIFLVTPRSMKCLVIVLIWLVDLVVLDWLNVFWFNLRTIGFLFFVWENCLAFIFYLSLITIYMISYVFYYLNSTIWKFYLIGSLYDITIRLFVMSKVISWIPIFYTVLEIIWYGWFLWEINEFC